MEWLVYLICPLMMLFCMKGMLPGKKNCHDSNELSAVKKQLEIVSEQNKKLSERLNSLK
jgi:Protein of unknown function (DUF2933)